MDYERNWVQISLHSSCERHHHVIAKGKHNLVRGMLKDIGQRSDRDSSHKGRDDQHVNQHYCTKRYVIIAKEALLVIFFITAAICVLTLHVDHKRVRNPSVLWVGATKAVHFITFIVIIGAIISVFKHVFSLRKLQNRWRICILTFALSVV